MKQGWQRRLRERTTSIRTNQSSIWLVWPVPTVFASFEGIRSEASCRISGAGQVKEPRWISRRSLILLHAESLAEHGGLPGLRDEAGLAAALARAHHVYSYEPKLDLARLAGAYGFRIVRGHQIGSIVPHFGRWPSEGAEVDQQAFAHPAAR